MYIYLTSSGFLCVCYYADETKSLSRFNSRTQYLLKEVNGKFIRGTRSGLSSSYNNFAYLQCIYFMPMPKFFFEKWHLLARAQENQKHTFWDVSWPVKRNMKLIKQQFNNIIIYISFMSTVMAIWTYRRRTQDILSSDNLRKMSFVDLKAFENKILYM